MKKEKELLRKQLQLLAEQSEGATDMELAELSIAMCKVHKELNHHALTSISLFSVVGLDLLVSIIVLIENFLGG